MTVTDPMPTYDGDPHSATAAAKGVDGTTSVSGSFSFTYDGSATAPTNAKTSYAVAANFTSSDSNYSDATGNGFLTIKKATPTVTVTDPMPTYDGDPHSATAAAKGVDGTTSVSGSFSFTYDGSATAPTNAKTSYAVAANFTSSDSNYSDATGNGFLTIKKATPTVTVTDPMPTYDGDPHSATAAAKGVDGTTSVSGSFSFTYDGSATAPTNAKTSYAVAANFTSSDSNYSDATGNGFLTIKKATPTVTVTDPMPTYDGDPHSATAAAKGVDGTTSVSGSFSFTYDGSATAPTNAKTSYAVVANFTSSDSNYSDATGNGFLTIKKATRDGGGNALTITNLRRRSAHRDRQSITGVNGATVAAPSAPMTGPTRQPMPRLSDGLLVLHWFGQLQRLATTTGLSRITKATATVVVTPYTSLTTTYDGHSHTATVTSITGVNGETGNAVGTVDVTNTTHTNAGTYTTDYWFFTGTAQLQRHWQHYDHR